MGLAVCWAAGQDEACQEGLFGKEGETETERGWSQVCPRGLAGLGSEEVHCLAGVGGWGGAWGRSQAPRQRWNFTGCVGCWDPTRWPLGADSGQEAAGWGRGSCVSWWVFRGRLAGKGWGWMPAWAAGLAAEAAGAEGEGDSGPRVRQGPA